MSEEQTALTYTPLTQRRRLTMMIIFNELLQRPEMGRSDKEMAQGRTNFQLENSLV